MVFIGYAVSFVLTLHFIIMLLLIGVAIINLFLKSNQLHSLEQRLFSVFYLFVKVIAGTIVVLISLGGLVLIFMIFVSIGWE